MKELVMKYFFQLLFSYNKMVFLRCELKNISNNFESDSGITFEHVSDVDRGYVDAIIKIGYPARITEGEIRERLKRGDHLYFARYEGQPISYQWVALNKYYIPYLDGEIYLDKNEIYGYGSAVQESFRGKGIFNQLRKFAYGELQKQGYEYGITSYMSWNESVERANKKFGYQEFGEVIYGYILLFRYFVNKMPKGKIRHLGDFWGKWKKLANR